MILCLCEKPSQARDIARNLRANRRHDGYFEGNGYQVTWAIGHLLEAAPPQYHQPDISPWKIEKLPVIPKQWVMQVSGRTKKQFIIVKKLLAETQHVLLATDYDREGESIGREILDYCGYQGKIERLCLTALDDKSIQKALKSIKPGAATESLYAAALGRQRSDYLINLNMTMAVSALYGVNSVLSVGRVQTPTLKLIVDRDRHIENFKSEDYFVLKALFSDSTNTPFWTTWKAPETVVDDQGYCLNQNTVESVAAKVDEEPGVVSHYKESKKTVCAPLCFSLSALQKKASSLWGYSAKQVLTIAQSLYEKHKATTYPRTDCAYLPDDQHDEVSSVLSAIRKIDPTIESVVCDCDIQKKSSVWDSDKITAHHAIIPTMNSHVDISAMSEEERNVYDLIRRYYMAQFMGDYIYTQKSIEIRCAGEIFIATSNTPVSQGWKEALSIVERNNVCDEEREGVIPAMEVGNHVTNNDTTVDRKKTKPPAHFSEGTLIDAMKTVGKLVDDAALKKVLKDSKGIGTEATRANIIEVLFKRGYIERRKRKVVATQKGRALIDIVPDLVKNPILTAQWEQKLEAIAEGSAQLDTFIQAQTNLLHDMLSAVRNESAHKQAAVLQLQSETQDGKVYLCPDCESPLRKLKNKKGSYFWGCSQYPKCCFTASKLSAV